MIETVRWQIVVAALAGWVNRHQREVIDYLREENRVLKEQLGGRRVRLTDAQRTDWRAGATRWGDRSWRRWPGS